jgi:hypothetical protein
MSPQIYQFAGKWRVVGGRGTTPADFLRYGLQKRPCYGRRPPCISLFLTASRPAG